MGALTSVYEATAADGRGGRLALKIFHPPPSTNIRRLYAIEGWLLAAERQQAAAQSGAPAVEILASGRCPEGAFAVMPWQEHSFESLVATLQPKGDFLRAVAERLLGALAEWEMRTGGPHGRLQPSNVFLSGSGELAGRSVKLSDPWFQPGGKPEARRRRDLAAVGAVLAEIVRRRPVSGWPIEEAPEWRALGRVGEAWRAYCNFLLNPQPDEGELTREQAQWRLRTIAADPRPTRNALLVASAVVVLAGGGVLGFARWGDPQGMPHALRRLAETTGNPRAFRAEVTPDWAKLCRAWAGWFGDLQRNADRWERTAGLWLPDDPVRAAILATRAQAPALRPQALVEAAENENRLGVLADAPPEDVRRELLRGTVAERVTEAWTQLDGLARQMAQWPRWEELRRISAEFKVRGYPRAGEALARRLPPEVAPDAVVDPIPLLARFNDFSLDEGSALSLAVRWSELTQLSAAMASSGDRIQAAMPGLFLADVTDRPALPDFVDGLERPLEELRRRRTQFLDSALVRERFLRESALLQETTMPTLDDLPRWERELRLYSRVAVVEDPRVSPELDARVARMTASAAELETDTPEAESEGGTVLNRVGFGQEIERWRGELRDLRSREIVQRDLDAVKSETERLSAALRGLEQRLEVSLALQRPESWLRRVSEQTGRLRASAQRWSAWRTTALSGASADVLQRDRPRFRALRSQERELRLWLDGLEGADGFGGLPVADAGAAAAPTAEALVRLEAELRERAAEAVVSAAEWRADVPVGSWAEAGASVRAPLEAHRGWLRELPAFAAELEALAKLLQEGRGWTEGVQEAMAKVNARSGVPDLSGPPAEWVEQGRQLSTLAETSDRATLTRASREGGLSQRLTAWRRLGALDDWPAGPEELDLDEAVTLALREAIEREVPDEARRADLFDELARENLNRWDGAARRAARDESALTAVFARMSRFGVKEEKLEGAMAYNLRLWRLKEAAQNLTDIEDLRRHRDEFAASVRTIGVAMHLPEVKSFLQKLGRIDLALEMAKNLLHAAGDRTGSVLQRAVPGNLLKGLGGKPKLLSPRVAGWHEELVDGGVRLSATWKGGGRRVQLPFLLVVPDDETPPFYLAERAIAVGEFLDLVGGRPQEGRKVIAALPAWTRGETLDKPWNKPMAWRPRADYRGLELNPTWFYLPDAQVKALLDNAELRARAPALEQMVAERPSVRSPLQQVPPEAAELFVRTLLGARLPRPQEWRAVAKQALAAETTGHYRGRSFEELWSFLDGYREGGQIVRWRPNEGVFLPLVATLDGGPKRVFADDGRARPDGRADQLWLSPVDEGPTIGGFVNLTGNVWIYLQDEAEGQFYVAGGSALAPPGLDVVEPLKVEVAGRIGARKVTEGFSDVGIRPAFDAPPGVRERFELLRLVREQRYLPL